LGEEGYIQIPAKGEKKRAKLAKVCFYNEAKEQVGIRAHAARIVPYLDFITLAFFVFKWLKKH
jgi:hypothetical protein